MKNNVLGLRLKKFLLWCELICLVKQVKSSKHLNYKNVSQNNKFYNKNYNLEKIAQALH